MARLPRLLPPLTLAFIAVVFAYGLRKDATGTALGTPRPPLLFDVEVNVALPWVVLAALLLAAGVAAGPRLLAIGAPRTFAAAILAVGLVLRLAVGAMDHGPEGWDEAFNDSFEAENEYPEALPAVAAVGTRFFLDHFAELIPSLPVHVAGHPPGLVVVLHAIGIDSGTGAAAFLIATGVLGVPLTYALARRLLDEDRARVAGLLAAFAPATMLYGVTAADILFATLGTLAALLLLSAPRVAATAGAAALAVGSFFSYALLAIGAWAALVRLDRGGLRVAVAVAAACGAALVLLYAGLYALVGFDMPGAIRRTADVYEVSVAQSRPYGFWVFGSAAAFLAFLGLPLTWYAARAAGERNAAALALAFVIVVSTVGGFTKAETERIWLMYVPLACVAAAAVLPPRRVPLVLALLAVQAFVVELVFGTVW